MFTRTLLLLALSSACALAAFPTLYLKNMCDDQLHAPTNITNAGDGSNRLFICDQPGKIYVFQAGMLLPTPFLDIGSTGLNKLTAFTTAYSERGLLGMCFHPGFSNPSSPGYRCFYLNYNAPSSFSTPNPVSGGATTNCVTVIAEYKVSATNPNVADPTSERVVLSYGQPQSNHNGGQIEFGPDGYLYIGSGDGGGANDNAIGHTEGTLPATPGRVSGTLGNGQDRRTLLGKILRIDPIDPDGAGPLTYAIPASNPFVGQTQDLAGTDLDGAMRGEIYAYGMRNPWRFCFDPNFGGAARMICADVGQLDVEEIDFITSGGNFGWRMKEGSVDFDSTITAFGGSPPSSIAPVAEYAHAVGALGGGAHGTLTGTPPQPVLPRLGASITGGYVYHGSAIPALQGKYIFGDYAQGGITAGGGVLLGLEQTSPGVFALSSGPLTVGNPLPSTARIYCFGKDESGEIYFAAKTTSGVLALDGGKPAGTIYKIQGLTSTSLTVNANRDNTMYEGTNNSNGIGAHLYAGQTGASGAELRRRALVRFDLSQIPAGVTISSASVSLTITKQIAQDFIFNLHKVTADWGEGGSNAGEPGGVGVAAQANDTTWTRRFHNTINWTSPGGDYVSTPSASKSIGNWLSEPVQVWSGGTLATDVQSWLATPGTNFGWLLRGDDTEEATPYTATRFASRHYSSAASRPKLTVTYSAAPSTPRFETWQNTYFPGSPPGAYLDPNGDNDGDGIANQVEYALNLDPLTRNAAPPLSLDRTDDQINTTATATFRRDPRATDTTYELQASEDLVSWTTVASSVEGGVTTSPGDAFVSEGPVVGESPMVLVTVSADLPGLEIATFIRLKITRTP